MTRSSCWRQGRRQARGTVEPRCDPRPDAAARRPRRRREGLNIAKRHTKPRPTQGPERPRCRRCSRAASSNRRCPIASEGHARLPALRPARRGSATSTLERRPPGPRLRPLRPAGGGEGRVSSNLQGAVRRPRSCRRSRSSSTTRTRCRCRGSRRSWSTSGWARRSRTPRRSTRPSATWPSITGQKPIVTKAKRSIAQFRAADGQHRSAPRSPSAASGCGISSSGSRVLALPAHPRLPGRAGQVVRRARQLQRSGCASSSRSPEIDYDKVDRLRGLEISIVTTAKTDEESQRAAGAPRHALRRLGAGRRTMAKKSMIAKAKRTPKLQGAGLPPVHALWPAPRLTCAGSRSAASASGSAPSRASCRA